MKHNLIFGEGYQEKTTTTETLLYAKHSGYFVYVTSLLEATPYGTYYYPPLAYIKGTWLACGWATF